jgi:protein-S-isoprenylcysteine O-methyltransferase Ste14
MSPQLTIVVGYVLINAVLAVLFTLQARADFRRLGKWSRPTALLSGLVMHGHFLATIVLAWLDRGSLFAANMTTLTIGTALFFAGAYIIFLGRYAYGSQQRVYGMLEDKLIRHGIYKRTRNPQYVGYGSMFAGAAIASGSGFALISTLLFMAIIHVFITQVEEPHLKQAFGEDFGQYTKAVPRYF